MKDAQGHGSSGRGGSSDTARTIAGLMERLHNTSPSEAGHQVALTQGIRNLMGGRPGTDSNHTAGASYRFGVGKRSY